MANAKSDIKMLAVNPNAFIVAGYRAEDDEQMFYLVISNVTYFDNQKLTKCCMKNEWCLNGRNNAHIYTR